MVAIEGLSHMTLHVTDLTRSEGFYRDIMGLEPVGRDLVSDDGPTSLFRASSGQLLVLVEMAAYLLVSLAALVRVSAGLAPAMAIELQTAAGIAWIAGFGIFILRYGPMHLREA